ncbi:MAG: hypothetical protein ACR2LD_02935, partial [Actinomycetota bacterium]
MEFIAMDEAIRQIERSNIDLEPEVLDAPAVRELLSRYAKAKKLVSYGETMLAAKLDDAEMVARTTGVSVGKAKAAVDTGNSLKSADEVREAFKSGEISLDQASEIAKAEQASPGSSTQLLRVAQEESFQTLREKVEKTRPGSRAAPGAGLAPARRSQGSQLPGRARHDLDQPAVGASCRGADRQPGRGRGRAALSLRQEDGRPRALRALPRRRLR